MKNHNCVFGMCVCVCVCFFFFFLNVMTCNLVSKTYSFLLIYKSATEQRYLKIEN